MNRWIHGICLFNLCLLLHLGIIACSTAPSSSLEFSSGKGRNELAEGDRYFAEGQYKRALLKYSGYVYSPFPNKKNLAQARYKLGLTHYMLGQHNEAYGTLKILLDENPDFPQANEAREIMEKSLQQAGLKKEEQEQQEAERLQKIAQYEQFVRQDPQNAEYQFELGNLYWQAGQYKRAVAAYESAAKLDPAILQQDTLRQRIRITDQGQFALRDPMLDLGRQEDLKLVNVSLQAAEQGNWLGKQKFLRFSGEIENQGLRDAKDVKIQVTIYDFFNRVHDTQTITIGRLQAGARRAFSTNIKLNDRELANDLTNYKTEILYNL